MENQTERISNRKWWVFWNRLILSFFLDGKNGNAIIVQFTLMWTKTKIEAIPSICQPKWIFWFAETVIAFSLTACAVRNRSNTSLSLSPPPPIPSLFLSFHMRSEYRKTNRSPRHCYFNNDWRMRRYLAHSCLLFGVSFAFHISKKNWRLKGPLILLPRRKWAPSKFYCCCHSNFSEPTTVHGEKIKSIEPCKTMKISLEILIKYSSTVQAAASDLLKWPSINWAEYTSATVAYLQCNI